MSIPTVRFRVEFKGAVPKHYPHAVTVPVKDEEEAKMWAKKQLEAWGIEPKQSNFSVCKVEDKPVPVETKDAVNAPVKKGKNKKEKK
jgi:hypothetical protein